MPNIIKNILKMFRCIL